MSASKCNPEFQSVYICLFVVEQLLLVSYMIRTVQIYIIKFARQNFLSEFLK